MLWRRKAKILYGEKKKKQTQKQKIHPKLIVKHLIFSIPIHLVLFCQLYFSFKYSERNH